VLVCYHIYMAAYTKLVCARHGHVEHIIARIVRLASELYMEQVNKR
jgi:hypothetical protein